MTTAAAEMPFPQDTRSLAYQLMADLQKLANSSAQTQLGRWDGRGVPGWVGEAEDAYTSSIKYLDGKLNQLIAALRHAAEQVGAWGDLLKQAIDTDIPNLHEAWDEVTIFEERQRQKINDALEAGEIDPAYAWIRHQSLDEDVLRQRNDLRAKYKQLLQALDTEAAVLATRLGEARAMVLPPQTGGSRAEIGQSLFKDGSILEAQNRWEHSEQRAKEIAKELEKGFETSNSRELSEQVSAFLDKYGHDLEDPFVATRLGQLIPPERLTNLGLDAVANASDSKVRIQLLEKLGAVMVLASGGVNLAPGAAANQQLYLQFEKALPGTHDGDVSLHEKYATQLMQAGRAEYERPWLVGPSAKGFEVLSQMMGQAGLSNPDLMMGEELLRTKDDQGTFMHDLIRHDHQVMSGLRNGEDMWPWGGRRRAFLDLDERLEDPVFALMTLMDQPPGFPEDPSQELLRENQERVDAVREFLGSEVQGVGPGAVNVTEHIMGGRTLNEKLLVQDGERKAYSGFPDGGVLFSALAAEAAFPESAEGLDDLSPEERAAWKQRDELGATIAKGYLKGYQNGLDTYRPSGADEIEGQRPYGYANHAMRSLAADVLGPRLKGISMSLSGTDTYGADEMQDKGRSLVILDRATADKLRGPGGMLVDLAFDGAELQNSIEKGEPICYRATATDKLLFWASKGYGDDLRVRMRAAADSSNPTKGIVEETGNWTPIVETLFEAPEGASAQVQEVINRRNGAWQAGVKTVGTLGAGAAALFTGPVKGFAITSAEQLIYEPLVEAVFPVDQTVSAAPLKTGPTTDLMMSTLATVAAEELDFSKAPEKPSFHFADSKWKREIVGPGESILPLSSMSTNARADFYHYLTGSLTDWEFDEAKSRMESRASIINYINRNNVTTSATPQPTASESPR